MHVVTDELEPTRSQMRKGVLELCILLSVSGEPSYSSDILAELKRHGLLLVEGTLYPLLSRLKGEELLTYEWRESDAGPPRKYYRLTERGQRSLGQLLETWGELSKSISSLIRKHNKD